MTLVVVLAWAATLLVLRWQGRWIEARDTQAANQARETRHAAYLEALKRHRSKQAALDAAETATRSPHPYRINAAQDDEVPPPPRAMPPPPPPAFRLSGG